MPTKNLRLREARILQRPPGAGMLRICPSCRKLFGLKYERAEQNQAGGVTDLYRCKRCGQEVTIARRHPPHAV